jgi:transposase-like protein
MKVKGRWTYLYRAVDRLGQTVDFLLSERRDVMAAKRFFSKAIKKHGTPRVITLDAYAASHRAVTELKSMGTIAHCGAGSSPHQTADSADARVQAI